MQDISPRLYRYALVRLGSVPLAEEAVAETLFRLIQKGPSLTSERSHIQGWCVRCIVNVCRETGRQRKHANIDQLKSVSMKLSDWHQQQSGGEKTTAITAAMQTLTERQREAVTLRVLMGHSVAQVAIIMDCAEGTIKALTHQGLNSLRSQLQSGDLANFRNPSQEVG